MQNLENLDSELEKLEFEYKQLQKIKRLKWLKLQLKINKERAEGSGLDKLFFDWLVKNLTEFQDRSYPLLMRENSIVISIKLIKQALKEFHGEFANDICLDTLTKIIKNSEIPVLSIHPKDLIVSEARL
jgi:hypothetical protein